MIKRKDVDADDPNEDFDQKERKRKVSSKPKKEKKRKSVLPKKIIPLPNADKGFTEKWYPGRDELDIPKPFRMILAGPPSSGKSTCVKNILCRCEFEEVYVCHFDQETTEEYDDINLTYFENHLPDVSLLKGSRDIKKALIIEDMDLSSMNKYEKKTLDRLFGNVSSHDNVSIFYCVQDPLNVPLCARRVSNFFVLWKQPDLLALSLMGARTGFDQKRFAHLFNKLKDTHDSLWVDLTRNSPYPLRMNGYIPINDDNAR